MVGGTSSETSYGLHLMARDDRSVYDDSFKFVTLISVKSLSTPA